jgi:hypothetical protein
LNGRVRTLVSLPNHLWVVWWKGSDVGGNWLLTLFYGLMAAAVMAAWVRLFLHLRRGQAHGEDRRRGLALIYVATVLVYAAAVIQSYYQGMIPVSQGRLLLPAIVPFVLLLVWGLWLYRGHEWMLLALVVILWGMGIFALFGNLIPYFYYWSDVVAGVIQVAPLNAWQWLSLVYQRALFDKPAFFAPLLWALPLCYGAALLYTFIVLLREMTSPQHSVAGGEHPRYP